MDLAKSAEAVHDGYSPSISLCRNTPDVMVLLILSFTSPLKLFLLFMLFPLSTDVIGADLVNAISATICNLELKFISLIPLLISYSITFHPLPRYSRAWRCRSLLARPHPSR